MEDAPDLRLDEREFCERARFLWESAHRHAEKAPELSRNIIRELVRLADHEQVALPARALQRVCSRCMTLLVAGVNCTASQQTHRRRSHSCRRTLRIRCHHCSRVNTFPMAAKEPARAASAAPTAAPAPKRAKSSAPVAARAALVAGPAKPGTSARRSKRPAPRAAPAPAPAPASAGDLYGFDFVPLV